MTVTITSSLRIGLVSGTGVNIDSPVVPQFTTDDIFDSQNPSQTVTDLFNGISSETLAGTISVNGLSTGNHSIYTVPAGDLFIPTKLVLVPTTVTGSGTPPAISVGFSGSFRELVDETIGTHYELSGGSINAAGSAYTASDDLTLSGGTSTTAAVLDVTSVSSGAVTAFTVTTPGDYTVLPANPISVTGGTGTNFKLNGTWAVLAGTMVGLDAANDLLVIDDFTTTGSNSGDDYNAITGGNVLTIRVATVASGFSAYTFKVMLFGFTTQ